MPPITENHAIRNNDLAFLQQENQEMHSKAPKDRITEYIEGNRVLPPGTPMPGPYSFDINPYTREPSDHMAPSSPIQYIYIIKGVQITITTTLVENSVAYYIEELPAEQLLVSGTDDLLKEWMEIRAEPLIDSMNLRRLIKSQAKGDNNRKTGDTADKKMYSGGALHMGSARSAPGQRMKSKQIVYIDEADSAPKELKTGEGNYVGVLEGRQVTYGRRKKMVVLSTPTTFEESVVYPLYQSGDQRHYYMPCPHTDCGAELTLLWEGFRADLTEDGKIISVWYECPHCEQKIYNHHKSEMLPSGRWVAHEKSRDKFTISYYIPAFLSPLGMLTWTEIYQKYLEALEDPSRMPSFVNLYCGLPYLEIGSRPNWKKVCKLRSTYKSREIPDGVLFLTMAMDVQQGSKAKKAPARVEIEVLGHGAGYRTWSIEYIIVEGGIKDAFDGAWEKIHQMYSDGYFSYRRSDGMEFQPRLTFIDSGDGTEYTTVYEFTQRVQFCFPIKGFGYKKIKDRKIDDKDHETVNNYRRYRASVQTSHGVTLYDISTNHYRNLVYRNIDLKRDPASKVQKPGFCEFPSDYTDTYFKQLTAAEKLPDNSYSKAGRDIEALDCRAYNLCAGEVFLDGHVAQLRAQKKQEGHSGVELLDITKATVLQILKMATERVAGEV
jgi:phage terminase large subunit GpA-like protein